MQFECGREVSQVQCEGQWSRQRDQLLPASCGGGQVERLKGRKRS